MNEQKKNRLMMVACFGSLASTGVLLCAKVVAFIGTGSVAILSSLFDSVQDLMTSMINMIAVRQAIQPADKSHRFGHGKAQGIGGLLQAFIIAISSIWLLIESISHLIHVEPVQRIDLGIWVTFFSMVIAFILVAFQNYVIRETNALSIKADRAHYAGDTLMNLGVLLSLVIYRYLGWTWIDGVFGIAVSIYLFYVVCGVMQEACAMLMDKELSIEIRNEIKQLALSVPLVKQIALLKTRAGGNKRFAQFNVLFDENISLKKAHAQIDLIEQKIAEKYPDMDVMIHAEPFIKEKQKKGLKCRA